MTRFKRPNLAAEARRRNLEQLARLGGDVRAARERRRLTQEEAARRAGISRSAQGRIERGEGGGHSLDTWQRVSLAVGRPLVVGLQRDTFEDTADAGHLAIQELVLRLGRRAGFAGAFELATRPFEPWRSVDVGLRDDRRRVLVLVECWNTFGDIGAAVRATARKLAEATAYAIGIWGTAPHYVLSVWVVRATRRNRTLVARYPEIFRARFPGSSAACVRLLAGAATDAMPEGPGLIWCDSAATRLYAWRRR